MSVVPKWHVIIKNLYSFDSHILYDCLLYLHISSARIVTEIDRQNHCVPSPSFLAQMIRPVPILPLSITAQCKVGKKKIN